GSNLPKSISSILGSKLGKVYKSRGINDFMKALRMSYLALKGESDVRKVEEDIVEVKTIYSRNFCPIGGKHNPKNAKIFQDSICTPFTVSFISEIDSSFKFVGDIKECILNTNENTCHYLLHLEEKEK
ncbi:unnamed protein product, partial [marine sediment metagenome]